MDGGGRDPTGPGNPADWAPRTKLLRPEVSAAVALDGELLARTARAVATMPITVISAQAGAGKTTLAAAAVAASGLPTGWVSLDAGDDDPTALLHLLTSAVEGVVPGGVAGVRALLGSGLPVGGSFRRVAGVLINDVLAMESPLFAIVLDDVHVVTAPGAVDLLDGLVAHLPGCLHLVLVGRADPPLTLSRLRSAGRVHEVRGEALRLAPEQASRVLNDHLGLGLAPERITAVVERVNGWATGVHLLGRSAVGDGAPALEPGADPAVLHDYLADEVLAAEAADVQQLLFDVAVLGPIEQASARALSGRDDAIAVLDGLARRLQLLVIVVDRAAGVYGLHDLFRSFLLRRLAAVDPDGVADRHRRAAEVVTDPYARIAHLLEAGDRPAAAADIEKLGRVAVGRRFEVARLAGWATRVGLSSPWLDLIRGVAAASRGDVDEARRLVNPLLADPALDDLLGQWVALHTDQIASHDSARWVREGIPLRADPRFDDLPGAIRVQMEISSAYAALYTARWSDAADHLAVALATTRASGDDGAVETMALHVSPILMAGDGAIDQVEAYLAWRPPSVDDPLSVARLGRYHQEALVAFLRARFPEALAATARGRVVLDRLGGAPYLRATFDWADAAAWSAQGELDRAEAVLARRDVAPASALDEDLTFTSLPLRAWFLRVAGRTDEVRALARRAPRGTVGGVTSRAVDAARIGLSAQAAWAEGDLDGAAEGLEQAAALEDELRMVPFGSSSRLALAVAHEARGDRAASDREAACALRSVGARGLPGLAAALGLPVVPVLERALARGVEPPTTGAALAALGAPRRSSPRPVPGTGEVLTAREVEVLRLLVEGASNRQVADALYISEHTVKTHVRRVLAKLGARSRSHAAALARTHHLV